MSTATIDVRRVGIGVVTHAGDIRLKDEARGRPTLIIRGSRGQIKAAAKNLGDAVGILAADDLAQLIEERESLRDLAAVLLIAAEYRGFDDAKLRELVAELMTRGQPSRAIESRVMALARCAHEARAATGIDDGPGEGKGSGG